MPDFLRELFRPVEVKVNIEFVLAILGIILAIASLIPKRARPKKKLSIKQADDYPIVKVFDEVLKDRVTILFDGHPSENIYELVIYLRNTGIDVLKEDDFHRSCSIKFGKEVKVRDLSVFTTDEFSKALTTFDNQTVVLGIQLLEPKAYLKMKILYESECMVDTKFESNIIGGQRIRSDLQFYNDFEHYIGAKKDSNAWLAISFLLGGLTWVLEIFIVENSLGIDVFDSKFVPIIPHGWFAMFFIIPLIIIYKLFKDLHFGRQPWLKIKDWIKIK